LLILAYARAWEPCRQLDDYSREFTALRGLQNHHQNDFALGVERGEVGVLEDIAVDRQRHALVDLADESAAAPRRAA
jgi:hypothetical protein